MKGTSFDVLQYTAYDHICNDSVKDILSEIKGIVL